MANSVKGSVTIREADGTDYSSEAARAEPINLPEVTDATQTTHKQLVSASTGAGLAITLPGTCYGFAVKNTDSTNFVTFTFDDSTPNTITGDLQAGQVMLFTDTNLGATLTLAADTAACICEVTLWGKA